MGLISEIIAGGSVEASTFQDALSDFLKGNDTFSPKTKSGARVSESTSLSVSTVYACIKIISWTLASLPIITYKRLKPKGKERARDYPIYNLLHDKPNPEQTPFTYKSLTSVHQNLWGAGISEIEFDKHGQPIALWPIPPWKVKPFRTQKRELAYRVSLPNGSTQDLPAYKTLVFQALGTSTDKWLSPIGVHRETIGLAIAIKDFAARTFGQGTNPAAQMIYPGKFPSEMSDKNYRSEMRKEYEGLSNSHRLMFLENGMEFKKIGLPPQDAQYLESQKFSVADIARVFNVPLHLIQSLESSTSFGKGLEEITQGFIIYSLTPYLTQWEQEYDRRLIFDGEHFTQFLLDALLRGNLLDRYRAYAIARNWGFLNVDEIREIENKNSLPEKKGEIYLSPLNMTTTEQLLLKPDQE